jgi:hypothetical protein
MVKLSKEDKRAMAAELSVPERVLLFCVASGTDWEQVGITKAMVTAMIIRGLIQRDPLARLFLTKQGRDVFKALVVAKLNDYQRRALEMLAHQDGCAEAVLLAEASRSVS